MPERVQLRRTKGWRLPAGAVNVARPTRWGNPFVAERGNTQRAVALYRRALEAGNLKITCEDVRRDLAGKDLACWCWRDWTCHADVLLEIANAQSSVPSTAGAQEDSGSERQLASEPLTDDPADGDKQTP